MSISDDSGALRSRPLEERELEERPAEDSARYANYDPGGGAGPIASEPGPEPIPGDEVTGVIEPEPEEPAVIPGDEVTGVIPEPPPARECEVYVHYDVYRTAGDERVCPECGPLDGTEHVSGYGPYPPLHDHCRCTRRPSRWECYTSAGEWVASGRGVAWE